VTSAEDLELEVLVLRTKLYRATAHFLLHGWAQQQEPTPSEKEINFIEEFFLAIQAGRGTQECEYHAEKDGIDVAAWKDKMKAAIKETEDAW
jgi:hypothetical protein